MNEINSMVKTAGYQLDHATDWQSLSSAVETLLAIVSLQAAKIGSLRERVNELENKVEAQS